MLDLFACVLPCCTAWGLHVANARAAGVLVSSGAGIKVCGRHQVPQWAGGCVLQCSTLCKAACTGQDMRAAVVGVALNSRVSAGGVYRTLPRDIHVCVQCVR
jgi:hypothetical protein